MQQSPMPLSKAESSGFPFNATPSSLPSTPKTTSFGSMSPHRSLSVFGVTAEQYNNHLEEQQGYATKREELVTALDSSTSLVKQLAAFNQEKWTIHYPHQLGLAGTNHVQRLQTPASAPSTPPRSALKGSRASQLHRSASLFTEEVLQEEDSPKRPAVPQRAYSTAETPAKNVAQTNLTAPPIHPLSILSLDLKLGHPTAPTASLPALLPSLSLATLSQLLSRRLTSAQNHINSLRARVVDTSSRILITGDLNAGKSTLVNALLRREVMPSDQQPLTNVFCEVMDASEYNEGKEELHAIYHADKYDKNDAATFKIFSLDEINSVQDMENEFELVKAFVHDSRAPAADSEPNPSFIKNGLVNISLIDAPGLNRDTISTTAIFARQSEIDVIVFVVSAENHFTLSAKEFLWNASQEKAYVFIVVNKWAAIKDKARCMRLVGEQIKQLSPATWENRAELVHWVDAAESIDQEETPAGDLTADLAEPTSFDHLEQSLRSFVLLKRTKSKLAPAKHYLLNLLADLTTLAETNVSAASEQLAQALRELARVKPIHEKLIAQRDGVEQGVDKVEETVVQTVQSAAWSRLDRALKFVGRGEIVPRMETNAPKLAEDELVAPTTLPAYSGLLNLWDWANQVKETLVQALEAEVRAAEDEARVETVKGVKLVVSDLANKFLPADSSATTAPAEQTERVFRPEVMFAKRRRGAGRLAALGNCQGLGLAQIGFNTSFSQTDFEVSFLDLFDFERIFAHGKSLRGDTSKSSELDLVEKRTILGLGLGSLGMIGTRVIGVKGTFDSLTRMIEVLASDKAKKFAAPILGLATAGLIFYIIIDLPRAIPRNIGRKLQKSLESNIETSTFSSGTSSPPVTFSSAHSDRIARETRKVLRLAGWDLRERFRAALEHSAAERKQVESSVAKSESALSFLKEYVEHVKEVDQKVEAVELD